jgi:hypothetical protein
MLNMFAVSTYHLSLIVFGNKGRLVLKFYKFDEKRAITPRWVIRFTSNLQGMQILMC